MTNYATQTRVSVAASKAEIEQTFVRFGIRDIGSFTEGNRAVIMFKHAGRPYSIYVTMPDPANREFHVTPTRGTERTKEQAYAAWEQACRVKWRELALLIKAKLVAIDSDAATFQDEFLAYAMLPDRSTVGDWAEAQLDGLLSQGKLPALLPGSGVRK